MKRFVRDHMGFIRAVPGRTLHAKVWCLLSCPAPCPPPPRKLGTGKMFVVKGGILLHFDWSLTNYLFVVGGLTRGIKSQATELRESLGHTNNPTTISASSGGEKVLVQEGIRS